MAKDPLEIEFGKIVALRRKAEGWSRGDLAEKSGFIVQTIGKIERAETSLTTNNINALAKAFKVHPAYLFKIDANDPMLSPLASALVNLILELSTDEIRHLTAFLRTNQKRMRQ
ncbi:helix-turn-helix domain-containing protein [Asticcacaulis endophyticus]|uniref:HTH cro/C1-type domain-containing protein n=1 Tax=Asticcacaulis endophyticus TaxID=1395890 RepID=A0A918Q558_9CAUL|nr:helix-turn-helix transcriptional regulator [Asticcacaulis endophyticus]GGZ32390.1 hypothetical protein GCM10011273_18160 [Asticcacaulis endophyticus]